MGSSSADIRPEDLMRTAAWHVLVIAALTACDGASDPSRTEIPTAGPSFAEITLNGDAWVPGIRSYFRNGDYFSFGFDRPVPGTLQSEGIGLFIPGFTGVGSYSLGEFTASTPSAGYGVSSAGSGGAILTTDDDSGLLRITGYDPTDSTVAGTFHFVVHSNASPTPTRIFQGSFRIRPSEQLSAEGARTP
jgi:hypothetical protein